MTTSIPEKVAKVACCYAIGIAGGHLGLLAFGLMGIVGGVAATEAAKEGIKLFGEKAGEVAAEIGLEAFATKHIGLEALFCQALQKTFNHIYPVPQRRPRRQEAIDPDSTNLNDYDDWFRNWKAALKPGNLEILHQIPIGEDTPENYERRLSECLALLNTIGQQDHDGPLSITYRPGQLIAPPPPLIALLKERVPNLLLDYFRELLTSPENSKARSEYVLNFILSFQQLAPLIHETHAAALGTHEDTRVILPAVQRTEAGVKALPEDMRRVFQEEFSKAFGAGMVPVSAVQERDEIIANLQRDLAKFQQERESRAPEPTEDQVTTLINEGKFDEAFRLKSEKVARENLAIEKADQYRQAKPRDYYDLGVLCELRFDWPAALENFRQAWLLSDLTNGEYGFKYALFAQKLKRFNEAIAAYEGLLQVRAKSGDVATTLNNLAILYRETQRWQRAKESLEEALISCRDLAEANPEIYLPYLATTLNNLALLHSETQRMREAEEAYGEVLEILRELSETNPDAYLPDVARTLNNLALLYSATQRIQEAEEAYGEALAIRRGLAEANPGAYLPVVAMTQNNLAILYIDTQRMQQAEEAGGEALTSFRKLAEANPDAYLPYVAATLNNLANLYFDTQCMQKAEEAYGEALATYRKLAEANPDAYLPDVARSLINLANLYGITQRLQKAEEAGEEALTSFRKLADASPDAYLPYVATTLNNLANLYFDTQRIQKAEDALKEALDIRSRLAEANPGAYLPDVAATLNNLANLYKNTQRMRSAEEASTESEGILNPLWQTNPALHGNDLARILWTRAEIHEAGDRPADACSFARRAFAAAYDPALKKAAQEIIDRLCPELPSAAG